MSTSLHDDDRKAVDMLLNFENTGAPPPRLQAAIKVLSPLQFYPTPEPHPDLVARTLRRIDSAIAAVDKMDKMDKIQPIHRSSTPEEVGSGLSTHFE